MKYERIPTDDPIRQIWNRLDVLSTVTGARNFLVKKYQENNITPQQAVLDDKANGLAFCIRSANEYFKVPIEGNLTTACLAYYYGTFSLFKALLISNVNNTITLKDIEKYTIKGHGLTALTRDGGDYPEFEYIAILSNGFFAKYLQEYGYNISDIAVTKAYKNFSEITLEADKNKVISVKDLFSRVPELRQTYTELFNSQPNYVAFSVFGDPNTGPVNLTFPMEYNTDYINAEFIINTLGLPQNAKIEKGEQYGAEGFKTIEPIDGQLVKKISDNRYVSMMCRSCYVQPILGINDVLLIDFMLLYSLSILVRYRPELWRNINEGNYDLYRPLITNFLIAVERVVPNIVLNRLYDKNFMFAVLLYPG